MIAEDRAEIHREGRTRPGCGRNKASCGPLKARIPRPALQNAREVIRFPSMRRSASVARAERGMSESVFVKPAWIRVRAGQGEAYQQTLSRLRAHRLHTVCEEALCPNRGHCWSAGRATILILGDRCTRRCRFCNVDKRPVPPPDPEEILIEVLVPDFGGDATALRLVCDAQPAVLGHNL